MVAIKNHDAKMAERLLKVPTLDLSTIAIQAPEEAIAQDMAIVAEQLLNQESYNVDILVDGFPGPLAVAVFKNNEDMAKKLIAKGANIELLDELQGTPLMIAAFENHANLVDLLLKAGANVNAQNEEALLLASNVPIAERLLLAGANVNHVHSDGDTPLLRAIDTAKPDLVKLLISWGANISTPLPDGKTILQYVKEKPTDQDNFAEAIKDSIIKILKEKSAQ
jgi:ankyrin repeat protein